MLEQRKTKRQLSFFQQYENESARYEPRNAE